MIEQLVILRLSQFSSTIKHAIKPKNAPNNKYLPAKEQISHVISIEGKNYIILVLNSILCPAAETIVKTHNRVPYKPHMQA